jgi:Lon protease-like protein
MTAGEMGLFALGAALVPGEVIPLHIFEERYKDLVADCVERDVEFGLLYADDDGAREIGCAARVTEILEHLPDGRMNILVRGESVIRVVEITHGRSYMTGRVEPVGDDLAVADEGAAARDLYRRVAELAGADPELEEGDSPLSYAIAARIELPPAEKQGLLELRSERARLTSLADLLNRGLKGLAAAAEIRRRAASNGRVSPPSGGERGDPS